jgi:hypothetical protein
VFSAMHPQECDPVNRRCCDSLSVIAAAAGIYHSPEVNPSKVLSWMLRDSVHEIDTNVMCCWHMQCICVQTWKEPSSMPGRCCGSIKQHNMTSWPVTR